MTNILVNRATTNELESNRIQAKFEPPHWLGWLWTSKSESPLRRPTAFSSFLIFPLLLIVPLILHALSPTIMTQ